MPRKLTALPCPKPCASGNLGAHGPCIFLQGHLGGPCCCVDCAEPILRDWYGRDDDPRDDDRYGTTEVECGV